MRPVNRVQPIGPARAYKTYSIASPLATHFRVASCAEVECQQYRQGWTTTVLPGSHEEAVLRRAADGLDDGHRRRFTEHRAPDGFLRFDFPAEQPCFRTSTHQVPLQRPEIYVVRGGDWRGNPTGDVRRHDRPEHWVEDCAEHLDYVSRKAGQG